jgi:multidrug efflux pump subunit AcrA (membrane-fusion protein)
MSQLREVNVPDIGDFAEVEIIEVHVAAGDTVAAEDPLITLESDKAAMELPSPNAGKVAEVPNQSSRRLTRRRSVRLLPALFQPGTTLARSITKHSWSYWDQVRAATRPHSAPRIWA